MSSAKASETQTGPGSATPSGHAQRDVLPVGRILSQLRRENGWTLADVSRMTGVSISTLSKVENNQTAPAYSVLTRLAEGLAIDFGALIGDRPSRPAVAARTVTRAGQGMVYTNRMGRYEALATELAAKRIEPMIIEIPAHEGAPRHVRSDHLGEEFVYVLSGEVVFEMDPYSPLVLAPGDSVYFDSTASHGFSAVGDQPARILSICYIENRVRNAVISEDAKKR